jgi:ribosomal protein S18 acetylase RimI-like enzyme
MIEVRLAQKDDIARQKELWKLCFGDDDRFIDFYYSNRYKENEALLLLQNGIIVAMLTMISVKVVTPDNRHFDSTMLYAIATHPKYQNRGLATRLIDYCNQYLLSNHKRISMVVPAEKDLFDFYRKQGYQEGFLIRELILTRNEINCFNSPYFQCTITTISADKYNLRRNLLLQGKLFIEYDNEEILYQKKLSQLSGADIFAIDIDSIKGCVVTERATLDKVIIKEILVPEEYLYPAIQKLAQLLPAQEYVLRTPSYLGEVLGGTIRPFGMIKVQKEKDRDIKFEELGYLGLAFD